jgi:uncharacterized protein (DUF983 family)
MSNKLNNFLKSIDTVSGYCQHCSEETILVAIVDDYYRCTSCGEDTKQYINGSIRYIKLTQEDEIWLRNQKVSE